MGKKRKAGKATALSKHTSPVTRNSLPSLLPGSPPRKTALEVARTLVGPAFIGVGLSVMAIYYIAGVVIVYTGFLLCICEIWYEAAINHLWTRLLCSAVVTALAIFFSVKVVFSSAPLRFDSYAMTGVAYAKGTEIGGILWDDRLTDMRVWVTNATDDDYTDVDIVIRPDQTTYRASILDGSGMCQLVSLGKEALATGKVTASGNGRYLIHSEGDHMSIHSDGVSSFQVLLSYGGYRLMCGKLPAHSSVQVVFALGVANEHMVGRSLIAKLGEPIPPPEIVATTPTSDLFDLFGPRPKPSFTLVDVHYHRGLKPFGAKWKLPVADGN